jgi:hypothetical protein
VGLPSIVFNNFKYNNKDRLGWWHVSCSYSFKKILRATLYNNDIKMESFSEPLNESNTYFPKSNLEGQFGKSSTSGNGVSGGMLIKEFRMWTEQRSVKQISLYMYS